MRELTILVAVALGIAIADLIAVVVLLNRVYALHKIAMDAIREERARDWKFIFEEQERRHKRELGDENWR